METVGQVGFPDEWSRYENYVGHRLTEEGMRYAIEEDIAHDPDTCPTCIADPAMGQLVHMGEQGMREMVQTLRPFFTDDVPDLLIANIGMSAYLVMHANGEKIAELAAAMGK